MEPIYAESPEELKRMVRERDVSVPPKGIKIENVDRNKLAETWVACRMLETLADTDLLQFPIRVEHDDRPDLVLTLPNSQIGVELTEATAKYRSWFVSGINRKNINSGESGIEVISTPRKRKPDTSRSKSETKAEMEALISSKALNEPPFMGNAIEREWLEGMIECIEAKTEKFLNDEFAKKPTNWLQIYDNWSPHPPDEHIVIKMLERELSDTGWEKIAK